MLLDDDTRITETYIYKVFEELGHSQVSAICPQIFDKEIQISPTSSETIKNLKYPKKLVITMKILLVFLVGLSYQNYS